MTDDTAQAKRALLAQRLRQRIAGRSYALSFPQQRLWFLDQLDPASAVYLVPLIYQITGVLDITALEQALTGVVRRHQVLRTVFRSVDGIPRQFVQPAEPLRIPVEDLSGEENPADAARWRCQLAARAPVNLAQDLMIRGLLLRLAPDEHWLCLVLHHIACDGWSLELLETELGTLYRAALSGDQAPLPDLTAQYTDFAERQVAELAGESLAEMLAYWRERLDGAPALASLPTDCPRPPTQTYAGAHLDFDLDPALTQPIDELARSLAATPFAVLLAAFAVLVHAYTGDRDVIVGTPVAGRPYAELRHLIGLFANTLVLRVDMSGAPAFRDLVAAARDESRAAIAHQDLPFEKLVEELHTSRDAAHNPVFQLMFGYHDRAAYGELDGPGLRLPGCEVTMVPGDTGTAKFDATLSVTRLDERFSARLEYRTDLFRTESIRELAENFGTVVRHALADPSQPIGRLPVLSAERRRRALAQASGALQPVPDMLVHELIARQAARTPNQPALLGADQPTAAALTYRVMNERADTIAARLRRLGVTPDSPVGVYLDRSPDLVIALLAVLKAGAAYLPLDPSYPPRRLALMIEDSGAAVIISRGGLAARLADGPATVLTLDEQAASGTEVQPGDGSDVPALTPGNLAYVIYTSGSTGRPKGVMISHRNVLNFFAGMDAVLAGDAPGSWLAVTSMSFDISVLELLWTLARGYRVVVRGEEPAAAAARLGAAAVPSSARRRPIEFSLFYFGGESGQGPAGQGPGGQGPAGQSRDRRDAYRLLLEGAKFADRGGFAAVWTPERHFHEFGGLYPNPSVTGAAIAAITRRVAIRAGSVVLPLHDPLRVAEEWSVVDNISGGRVGISLASGWQPNDFVLAPDTYADRKQIMLRQIEELRQLWRGGDVSRRNGAGASAQVRIFPPPLQPELPIWVTSARSPETFRLAGDIGAGLLTHLLGHTADQLAEKISLYRQAWRAAGHDGDGHVTLMLHTFVGADMDGVREIVREPLCAYIKSSFDLLTGLGQALGSSVDPRDLPDSELDELIGRAFERFFETAGLLGTPDVCADMVDHLKSIGVDEVAALIDFGVPDEQALAALDRLAAVKDIVAERQRIALADEPIATQLDRHGITHLQCTPSAAALLCDDAESSAPSAATLARLRRLLVGGEALPGTLAARLCGHGLAHRTRLHNMYGPTEATVWATMSELDGGDAVTIGLPLANVRCYVVDAYGRPTPANVAGELLLGGPGIARGYLGRPALTAQRFVPDPFSGEAGARLYRTGDLVRRRADGELEFLGRLDHQVKVRGHRIELGEIENTFASHPGIRGAVATVRDTETGSEIVAYCLTDRSDAATVSAQELRTYAAATLPDYMIPAHVMFLDDLPMTPNGKVDRGRLPAPERPRATYRPPGNEHERLAAEVLAQVLKADRIGVEDNFFEAGGNSLLAVEARARLRPVLGERLSLVDIFRYPTVRGLVAAFAGDGTGDLDADLVRVRGAAGRRADALARQAAARRPAGRA
jgi:natural product biosynthesis luciferase-like monooxygenase protein